MSTNNLIRHFSRITEIDIEADLLGCGITAVMLDIDNTIRSRDDGLVPTDVALWLEDAERAGIRLCMLSNNWHKNVQSLSRQLGIPVIGKALKPLGIGYMRALRKMGASARSTVMIGDQLFTDTTGAYLLGIRTYLVDPLSDHDLRGQKAIRALEQRIVKERNW